MRLAIVLLAASLLVGAVALGALVSARAQGTELAVALDGSAALRSGAGLGLCLAGLCWGLACAANLLDPTNRP